MASPTILYVATAHGIFTLKTVNSRDWKIESKSLENWGIPMIVVPPSQPNVVFAGTRGDGVWVSKDFGKSWEKPCRGKPGPGKVMCITLDPNDPNTLYVGTEPIDMFVSRDAGKNWTRLDSVWKVPSVESVFYPVDEVEPHARDIAVDPKDPKTIYLALQVGYILKTTDGGASWKVLDKGLDADVHTIVIDPTNTDKIYIATGGHDCRVGKSKGRALYISDDAGETWSPMGAEFSQEYSVPLVMHPKDPKVLYSAIANGQPRQWSRSSGAESLIIKTNDGGKKWERLNGSPSEMSIDFAQSLAIDEAEPNNLYAAIRSGELYSSVDGGDSWKKLGEKAAPTGDIFAFSDMRCVHA